MYLKKIAGTFTAAGGIYLQNLYIKYLRIWISYWGWERERIKRECWVKLANENLMDPEFRSSSNYIV